MFFFLQGGVKWWCSLHLFGWCRFHPILFGRCCFGWSCLPILPCCGAAFPRGWVLSSAPSLWVVLLFPSLSCAVLLSPPPFGVVQCVLLYWIRSLPKWQEGKGRRQQDPKQGSGTSGSPLEREKHQHTPKGDGNESTHQKERRKATSSNMRTCPFGRRRRRGGREHHDTKKRVVVLLRSLIVSCGAFSFPPLGGVALLLLLLLLLWAGAVFPIPSLGGGAFLSLPWVGWRCFPSSRRKPNEVT